MARVAEKVRITRRADRLTPARNKIEHAAKLCVAHADRGRRSRDCGGGGGGDARLEFGLGRLGCGCDMLGWCDFRITGGGFREPYESRGAWAPFGDVLPSGVAADCGPPVSGGGGRAGGGRCLWLHRYFLPDCPGCRNLFVVAVCETSGKSRARHPTRAF